MMSQILFSFWSHIFTIILISSDLLSLLKAESYGIFGLKKNSEWFSIENPWEIVDFSGFFFYFLEYQILEKKLAELTEENTCFLKTSNFC